MVMISDPPSLFPPILPDLQIKNVFEEHLNVWFYDQNAAASHSHCLQGHKPQNTAFLP